jgi:hypothetical protein
MEKKKTNESEELFAEYGHAYNFTRGDLEANRAGFITQRQRQMIYMPITRRLISLVFCIALMAAMLFWWSAAAPLENRTKFLFNPELCSSTTIMLILLIYSYLVLREILRIYLDYGQGRVKAYESYEAYSKVHYASIFSQNTNAILLTLRPNIRIYTLPRIGWVVSVEILDAEEDALDAKEKNNQ